MGQIKTRIGTSLSDTGQNIVIGTNGGHRISVASSNAFAVRTEILVFHKDDVETDLGHFPATADGLFEALKLTRKLENRRSR